jgi:hypothetical protein
MVVVSLHGTIEVGVGVRLEEVRMVRMRRYDLTLSSPLAFERIEL